MAAVTADVFTYVSLTKNKCMAHGSQVLQTIVHVQWVNSELRTSIKTSKGVIPVLETDPRHGGVAVEQLRSQCPKDVCAVLFDRQKPIQWHREVRAVYCVRA